MPAKEEQAPKYIRVKMLTGKSVEVSSGSFVQYQTGELYLLDEKTAKDWITDGSADDPLTEEQKGGE